MDTKNDDSAGSDSLDKSLQKKCVVDDMGQGEGTTTTTDSVDTGVEARNHCNAKTNDTVKKKSRENCTHEEIPENSTKKHKTEKSAGDCGESGAGEAGGGGTTAVDTVKAKAKYENPEKVLPTAMERNSTEESHKSTQQHNTSASASISKTVTAIDAEPNTNTTTAPSPTPTTSTSSSTNSNRHAFETKVKQISKNLKETTLAESANKKASLEDNTSSSSSSSSSSSTPSESEQNTPSCSSAGAAAAALSQAQTESDSSLPSGAAASESADEQDPRSKKVRFHPDVKENDGGNRVIPKKKKKLKASGSALGDDVASTSSGIRSSSGGTEDEMELDEEEEEDEDEFDVERTIAEAKEYLKSHPLTFARPQDKASGQLQSGLFEEEDLPQLSESSEEEEDFYEGVPPENGVERLLGKHIKCGKVEFLLRYADRPGLSWECEEWVSKHCPNLLIKYEENRDYRQERLMHHVSKRQNLRQRYTDF